MGEIGDLGPEGSIIFGIFVGLASTSIQSLGLTLQRKSHILEDEKSVELVRRPPYRRRRWQLGMLMFIVSNIVGSSIQITTLPLPALSALQASGLVFNSICATLILKEPFTRYSLAGTILVSVGAILIATFGAIGEPAHDLAQLLQLFERAEFLGWITATALLVLGAWMAGRALKSWRLNSPRTRVLRGMAFGFISGILSAHSLLLAKSAVELFVRTIVDHINQFNRWQSWMILLGLLGLALAQLYYLHRGLKLCSTSVLYPFVFCIYNIIAILDGLIYFNQASRLSLSHSLLVLLGTLVLLSGVICLSWRLDSEQRGTVQTPTIDADLADLAYQLDSDASSISSSILESPTERAPLLPTFSPTIPLHASPTPLGDLESGSRTGRDTGGARTSSDVGRTALSPTAQRRSVHWDASSDAIHSMKPASTTSTARERESAHINRLIALSRRQAFAEADALWDELQDEPSPLPTSTITGLGIGGPSNGGIGTDHLDETPSPRPFLPRTRSRSLAWQESRVGDGPGGLRSTPSPDPPSPRGSRGSPAGARFSPGPLNRVGTGRSYRARRGSRRFTHSGGSGNLAPTGAGGHTSGSAGFPFYGTMLGRRSTSGELPGSESGGGDGVVSGMEHRVRRWWRDARDAVAETVAETRRRSSLVANLPAADQSLEQQRRRRRTSRNGHANGTEEGDEEAGSTGLDHEPGGSGAAPGSAMG